MNIAIGSVRIMAHVKITKPTLLPYFLHVSVGYTLLHHKTGCTYSLIPYIFAEQQGVPLMETRCSSQLVYPPDHPRPAVPPAPWQHQAESFPSPM